MDLGGARVGVAGGNNAAYLVSYSPTGAFRWAQTIGPISNGGVTRVTSLAVRTTMTGTLNVWGSTSDETVSRLAIDPLDNVLLVGEYQTVFSFGARPLAAINGGTSDVFVTSIANDGTPNWATNIGSNNTDQAFGVVALPSGRVFVGGMFQAGTFPAGTFTASAAGLFNPDLFVVEYNPTTGAPIALSRYGGATTDRAYLPGQVSTFGQCGSTAICIGAQTLAMNMYPTTQFGNATLQAAFVPADASSNLDALWARIER